MAQRSINLRLVLPLACAIVIAQTASTVAAPDENAPEQNSEIRQPEAETAPPTPTGFCQALAAAAAENDLPVDFFIRLIWQESRFNPDSVSRAGRKGLPNLCRRPHD
jgi:soluble lytic murein transglycosylase-like protein